MTDTATKPAPAPTAGFKVIRTARDTWHVINQFNGDHWESNNQAEVLAAIQEYKDNAAAREAARKAAEEAAKNPQVGEFGTSIPGESTAFDNFIPVADSGKPNLPAVKADAPGGAPEPEEVQPQQTVTLTNEQFEALLAKAGGPGAQPEPEEVKPLATAREDS